MALPVSSKFDLFDWNIRSGDTEDTGDKSFGDATDPLRAHTFQTGVGSVVETAGYVSLSADADSNSGVNTVKAFASLTDLPAGVPDTFTFEFDIHLESDFLPRSFSTTEDRIFVGVVNQQFATAGFLFSHDGIALATYPEDPNFIILSGSKDLLYDDDVEGNPFLESMTVRAIVNGEDNRISVYIGDTSKVYEESFNDADISIKYNLAAPASLNSSGGPYSLFPIGDGLALQASAKPDPEDLALKCAFSLSSLRLSSSVLIPEARPIASAYTVRNTLVGTPITVFGGRSYDPGATGSLEYNWEIEIAPETSTATIQGAERAKITVGTEVDNNEVTISYKKPTAYANALPVEIKKGPPNSSLRVELEVGIDGALTILLGVDSLGVAYSTARDLERAFSDARSTGYNVAAVELFSVDLTNFDSTGDGILPEGSFTLTGGTGSPLANPLFIPDVLGAYNFSLTVYNGNRVSEKASVKFSVGITNQLLGHRPNSKYIFKYLPDFWNLVQDKEQVTTIWSALTQALSDDLLTLWQNDYSKTIRDISRRYQRRWQYYSTLIDLTSTGYDAATEETFAEITTTISFPEAIVTPTPLIATPNINGTHSKSSVITGSTPLSAGKCLVRGANAIIEVVNVVSVSTFVSELAEVFNTLTADSESFPYVLVLNENNNGFFVRDPEKVFSLPETSDIFTNVVYPLGSLLEDKKGVRLFTGPNKTLPVELVVTEQNSILTVPNTIRVDTSFTVSDERYTWQHIVPVEDMTIEQTPYITIGPALDLSEYTCVTGDYIDATVVDPYTGTDIEISLPILAVNDQDIFVDWTSFISALNVARGLSIDTDDPEWTLDGAFGPDGAAIPFTVTGIIKAKETFAVDEVIDVPRLGTSTIKSSMHQHVDYSVVDNKIVIKDWISCRAKTTAGKATIRAELPIDLHPQITTSTPFSSLTALGATTAIVRTGADAGVYTLTNVEVVEEGEVKFYELTLDQQLAHTGVVDVEVPRYGAYATTVHKFWAEVSYFDNKQTIENNFGLFVGLPEHVLRLYDKNKELDYLSVVRSLWFAFLSGPSFHNLQLALQTFFNLPYTERAGQVTHIQEPTDLEEGHLIVEEATGRASVYRFPLGATVGLNPTTDRTIKGYSGKPTETAPEDEVETYQDSLVDAYVKLIDLINFDDYISNPDLIDIQLKGQDIIKKYHTFIVDVPLGAVKSTEVFPLVRDFLKEAKPAYTNFILVGSLKIHDSIDAVDEEFLKPTVILRDTPHTASFFALTADVDSEAALWAEADTKSRIDGLGPDTWTVAALDVKERYESGYCEGVLDDYSGDGSFNRRHSTVDMVNNLTSDIDVVSSRLWVPCTIDTSALPVDFVEFITGEAVDIYFENNTVVPTLWNDSPPVILHIGSSVHPRIPFGVESPQLTHPYTYLLLGFENEETYPSDFYANGVDPGWEDVNCFANENRLDALELADELRITGSLGAAGTMYLKGRESEAKATLDVLIPSRTDASDAKYFLLEKIFQLDKLVEHGPKSTAHVALTKYVPMGGMEINTFRDPDPINILAPPFGEEGISREVQRSPYDSTVDDNRQFVPSFSPGFYSNWDNLNKTPGGDNLRWGYTDVGEVATIPVPVNLDEFDSVPAAGDLQNIHVGFKIKRIKGFHYTHGFTEFYIPPPNINRVTYTADAVDIRIEGYYFVAPEPNAVIPTPDTFNGTIGGCWVFFRNADTGVETPVQVEPVFETGLNPGKTVLGIDNPDQTSTGHILIVEIPQLTPGYYDIIVRNYRPYTVTSVSAQQLHIDVGVIENAYFHSPSGWGGVNWGTGPFGGVN